MPVCLVPGNWVASQQTRKLLFVLESEENELRWPLQWAVGNWGEERKSCSETSIGFSQRSPLLKQTQLELRVYCQMAKAEEGGVLNAKEGWGSETTGAIQPACYSLGKSFFSSVYTVACGSTKHRTGK